jgi:putative ABC transport system permease protein
VVLFVAAVSALSGLFVGLLPAIAVDRGRTQSSLYEGRSTATARTVRVRDGLLVGEVAVAVMLVVACALLAQTFTALLRVDGGYRADHVLTFELTLPATSYPEVDSIVTVYRRTLAQLAQLAGVRAAGLGETLPMAGAGEATAVRLPDHPVARPNQQPIVAYTIVSPHYFSALGTALVRGRYFDDHDTTDSRPVAIVNEAMARQFWPNQDPLERRVGVPIYPFDMAIVGVVADMKHQSLREKAGPEVYVPFTQKVWPSMQTMHFAVRTAGDPTVMTAAVRRSVAEVDPALAMASVATLDALVGESVAPPRFATLTVGSFTVIALVLVCVGLYGAAAYGVSQRVQEIGIRVALGASRSSILELVMRRGVAVTAAGLAIGILAAAAVAQTMRRFLFNVSPVDAATFAGAAALIVAVGLIATYLPARRAAALDPLTALRRE